MNVIVSVEHTWFCQRDQIRDVLHEDATFQLEFGLAALVDELLVGELVLGFAEVDVLAAEQDSFEEVDVVLHCIRVHRLARDSGSPQP